MSAAWVAGSVRAQAMARRRVGVVGARALAACGSVTEAVDTLARSPYSRGVRPGDTHQAAAWGVAATLLWNLRVLAGWLPASGAETLRLLAGWFEIANVDEHVRTLVGHPATQPFVLGTLATVWPRLAQSGSRDELRAALAASPWGDPGGATERDIQLSMRLAWAERVAARVPPARPWAHAAAALLVARERFARRQVLPEAAEASAARTLGPRCRAAASVPELREALSSQTRWVLDGVHAPAELWQGEVRWWRRLRHDAAGLVAGSGFAVQRVVGAAAVLAADAWLVRAALEAAARGPGALEVFDAMA